ncbi:GPP34 family phosphoprotein [Kitasatospora sp. DSM 101779]|uniref:GPP34 family phosphoprotein n=1 Tax=Kitasatospora sp. DSM 101779 TaxID=2853165 RepID=UPI0021D8D53C|nr:GPP34 family phosphoprotein [Kitasatospora sp. DSM 101779]MCU7826949.1 GPP34 family phosphoprotein [Kitasatospora sp. DSM 101779]
MDTTPQDLLIVALGASAGRRPEQGELSLALAGAELIDLLDVRAALLDDTRIVPLGPPAVADRLLAEAAAAVVREPPFESVEDWLWRRGRGLAAAYAAVFGAEGRVRRPRFHRTHGPEIGGQAPAESAGRRAALDRWESREPVLTALTVAVGIDGPPADKQPDIVDDAVAAVLAAVNDAVRELDAVRQRRAVEDAAFNNIWRGAVG